ncbi:MAG: class I SAM-dependent methyltransferase [Acidobacteria bacterium]|nr:MAG: class I SAM-dependent methyltransferase [Acidobacteriota bacterium]
MTERLRKALFDNYRYGQGEISSGALYKDIRAQWPYYEANYRRFVENLTQDAKILEVGTGPGSLLSWFSSQGYKDLAGVDTSPGDVAFANRHLGRELVQLGDGKDYLARHPGTYDAIFMKAILEHQPKEDLLPMIRAAARALSPGGFLLVDVPNMDWVFATHERYMDLTHETGFTRESLTALLRLVFEDIKVFGSVPANLTSGQRWLRRPLIRLLRFAFYILGEGAGDLLFESRSIIAIANRPKAACSSPQDHFE